MGAAENRAKSAKRTTTPHHNNIPTDEAGSAAYRRMRRK